MSEIFGDSKKTWLFIVLAGMFITSAITAELISNKLIEIPFQFELFGRHFGPFVTIVGILPWPFVFLLTDLLNEFYGRKVVQKLSWITAGLIGFCFLIVGLSLSIPAHSIPNSNIADDQSYNLVFGQAQMVIVGSICAFLISQLLDALIFEKIKSKTGNRFIWLRSTGSTVFSQLIDTYIVLYIGFVLNGSMSHSDYWQIAPVNYFLKLMIAIALTPLIYLGHFSINRYLLSSKGN